MATLNTSTESILVLGAGTLGLPILTKLAFSPRRFANTKITLASRSPALALVAMPAGHNVDTLPLDVPALSEHDLARALTPFTVVIGCTGMTFPAGTQLKIARAVLEAGVPRYLPWQFGVDYDQLREGGSSQDLFVEQIQVRDLLRAQQRTRWVIVSNGVFADFLMDEKSGFGVIEGPHEGKCTVRALGGWSNRITATSVPDIAATVEALVLAEKDADGVVFIAGQTLSYEDIAMAIEQTLGRNNVRREDWSTELLRKELEKDPTNGIKKYRAAFAAGTGMSWDENQTWNRQKKVQFRGLHDWIGDYIVNKE